jgi:hypothetical protein
MSRSNNKNVPIMDALKKQATAELDAGKTDVILDVHGLNMRERNIVRTHVNRWLKQRLARSDALRPGHMDAQRPPGRTTRA